MNRRMIMACALAALLGSLSGCIGGMNHLQVSSWTTGTPPSSMLALDHPDASVTYPSAVIANTLLIRLSADNYMRPQDLPTDHTGRDLSLWAIIAAKQGNVHVDWRSVTLELADGTPGITPSSIELASSVPDQEGLNGLSCEWGSHDSPYAANNGLPLPVYSKAHWPPDAKESFTPVLCVHVKFPSDVTPDKRFTVSFRYTVDGTQQIARMYFFPVRYKTFLG